jgi:hypothetical protein
MEDFPTQIIIDKKKVKHEKNHIFVTMNWLDNKYVTLPHEKDNYILVKK